MGMRKVVLINPYYDKPGMFKLLFKSFEFVPQFVLPPLGLLYLAAYVERLGFEVTVLDANLHKLKPADAAKKAIDENPCLIGISAVTATYSATKEIVQAIKQISRIPTVVGGPHTTALPEQVVRDGADFAVVGEGEIPLGELAKWAVGERKNTNIPGVSQLVNNAFLFRPAETIENLDAMPPKDWEKINIKQYRPSPASFKRLPAMATINSRGCPFACSFCNKKIFGARYRPESLPRVGKELDYLQAKGIVDINFWDDVFTIQRQRVIEEAALLKKRDFIWNCSTRVHLVDDKLLGVMANAGCYEIGFGVESGSQRILEKMNKNITIEQIKKAIKMTRQHGIHAKVYVMYGMPGETKEDMEKTLELVLDTDPDIAHFGIVVPYPGTKLWEEVKDSLGAVNNFEINFESLNLIASDLYSQKELSEMISTSFKRFYFRPRYVARAICGIRSFSDIRRYALAFASLL